MGRRLILDTTALIDAERGTAMDLFDDDDIAIAAVSLAEFGVGVHQARTQDIALRRKAALDKLSGGRSIQVETAIAVLTYDAETARHHSRLLAAVKNAGQPRGAHDLIIAAHARQTGRLVYSRDSRARFGDLPGVLLAADEL